MTLRIYDAPTGGAQLWQEFHGTVAVSNGAFSMMLGSISALTPAMLSAQRYLEVQVQEDPAMTPRQALAAVAQGRQVRQRLLRA